MGKSGSGIDGGGGFGGADFAASGRKLFIGGILLGLLALRKAAAASSAGLRLTLSAFVTGSALGSGGGVTPVPGSAVFW